MTSYYSQTVNGKLEKGTAKLTQWILPDKLYNNAQEDVQLWHFFDAQNFCGYFQEPLNCFANKEDYSCPLVLFTE